MPEKTVKNSSEKKGSVATFFTFLKEVDFYYRRTARVRLRGASSHVLSARRFTSLIYHQPSTFHHSMPMPSQMERWKMETTKPTENHFGTCT